MLCIAKMLYYIKKMLCYLDNFVSSIYHSSRVTCSTFLAGTSVYSIVAKANILALLLKTPQSLHILFRFVLMKDMVATWATQDCLADDSTGKLPISYDRVTKGVVGSDKHTQTSHHSN